MSRGELQEMEVGTKQSRTAVNANAKAAEPMTQLTGNIPDGQSISYQDCGGPTPDNYKPDDDSAKLSIGSTLKQVRDVVTRGAKAAEAMKMKEEKEEDKEDDDDDEKKKNKKKSEDDDDEEDMEEEYDIESDVNALISGEDLSEEFKEKAKTIFEAALKSKVSEIKEALESQYIERLNEEIEEIKEEFQDRVDSYLEYVSEEWIEENQLAVEHGLKSELTESFLMGMKQLFEEHYVSIPEDKYDVVHTMVNKLDEMETKLNEQIERNISLNKRLAESVADGIVSEISEGLTITQKEKLASLAENVEFEGENDFRERVETLKESYFPRVVNQNRNSDNLNESVESQPEYTGNMATYLNALSAVTKK
ncbi:MAG: hypothetical protein SCG72_01435 [Nitrosarchaeum sp.]|nr:hypothetical protein [Nitrosarchaeum sp.]